MGGGRGGGRAHAQLHTQRAGRPARTHLHAHLHLPSRCIEQELCARAHTFIGSKYSTWTDTVRGLRIHAQTNRGERPNSNWLFEELYMLGVK